MIYRIPRALCALALLISNVAIADKLETITVTASRTPTNIDDVGSAISILTREDIARRGATNLAQLLRDIPGLAISQQGGTGTLTQARVRGAEANQVLVLIDGIEANDIAQGSEFNFAHVLASDIERIEVVRGPQSALWGSDALSGVVNVITSPVGRSGFNGQVEAGSFSSVRGGVGFDHATDNASLSVAINHFDTDGTNVSRTGTEDDGYRNTTARINGKLELNDNIDLTLALRNTSSLTDFDDVDFVTTGLPVDAPFETDSSQRYGKVALNWRASDSFEQIVTISRTDTENINRTASAVDDVTRGTHDSVHLQSNLFLRQHTLSFLVEREWDDYEQRGEASFFGDPNKDLTADTTSIAGEWRYDGMLFDISASARHDNNSEFDNVNTWRLTGLVHIAPTTGLFASFGRGIKNPTFTERFGFFDTFIGNPGLRPEQSRSNEVGIRQSFADAGLDLSASYYTARLKDEINGFVFDAGTGAFTAENVSGASDRRGVELEFSWRANESIAIDGNYAWLDATEPGDIREIRRPENSATVRVNYHFDRGNVSLGFNYNGSQQDDYFPPFPPFQERVTLPSYTLVSLSGQYEISEKVTLTGRVENLLDETYEDVFGFRGQTLGAYAGVRVRL